MKFGGRIWLGAMAVWAIGVVASCDRASSEFAGHWELVSTGWDGWPLDEWSVEMDLGRSSGEYTVMMFGSNGGGRVDIDGMTDVEARLTLWRWVDEGSRMEDQAVLDCTLVDEGLDCVRDPEVQGGAFDFPDYGFEWRFERVGN